MPLPLPTHLEGTWVGLTSPLLSYEPPSLHFLLSSIKVPWQVELMFVSSSPRYLGVIFERKMGHECYICHVSHLETVSQFSWVWILLINTK